jgi:hypothetical protein
MAAFKGVEPTPGDEIVSLFGELERIFATVIFPNRVVLAIVLALVLLVVAIVAWRRRWDRPIRAHPRQAVAILVPLLVVGLPIAWVLGSPLFIRTELVEPGPTVGAEASDAVGTLVSSGTVVGADEFHTGSGRVSIIEVTPGSHVVRFDDFSVLNGPDLFVYLSPDPAGYAPGAVELGTLKATDGAFNYELPAGLDPTAFGSVVVWCKAFEVQFAHAALAAG